MKKVILTTLLLLSFYNGNCQEASTLYSNNKKLSYHFGYSNVNYSKYKTTNMINYNNASVINAGVNYRFLAKDNYQLTVGGILSYNTIEYKIQNNLSNTGTEIFLDIPLKIEYNFRVTDHFFITPNFGLNLSVYLNSEQRGFQDYYFNNTENFETTVKTKPFAIGGLLGLDFNIKSNKRVFGISLGYSNSFINNYEFTYSSNSSNNVFTQNLKRDYYSIGLKFTPKK